MTNNDSINTTLPNQPLPPLTAAEYEGLKKSVRENGQKVAILRHKATGELIDGHHRLAICTELGIVPFIDDLDCDNATAELLRIELNIHRRQLGPEQIKALQLRFGTTLYPTTKTPRATGGKGKASAIAKQVGQRIADMTGLPEEEVTPTLREVMEMRPQKQRAVRAGQILSPAETPQKTTKKDETRTAPDDTIPDGLLLADATEDQLLAQLIRVKGVPHEGKLATLILEAWIETLPNSLQTMRPWIEGKLSHALHRHITIGAIRSPASSKDKT